MHFYSVSVEVKKKFKTIHTLPLTDHFSTLSSKNPHPMGSVSRSTLLEIHFYFLMCRSNEIFHKNGKIWATLSLPKGPQWDTSYRMHHITFEH